MMLINLLLFFCLSITTFRDLCYASDPPRPSQKVKISGECFFNMATSRAQEANPFPSTYNCSEFGLPWERYGEAWSCPQFQISELELVQDPAGVKFFYWVQNGEAIGIPTLFNSTSEALGNNKPNPCNDRWEDDYVLACKIPPTMVILPILAEHVMNEVEQFENLYRPYENNPIIAAQIQNVRNSNDLFEYCTELQNLTRDIIWIDGQNEFKCMPSDFKIRNIKKEIGSCVAKRMKGPSGIAECRHWTPLYVYLFNELNKHPRFIKKFNASCTPVVNRPFNHVTLSIEHPCSNSKLTIDPYNFPGRVGVDYLDPIQAKIPRINLCSRRAELEAAPVLKKRAMNLVRPRLNCNGYEPISPGLNNYVPLNGSVVR